MASLCCARWATIATPEQPKKILLPYYSNATRSAATLA